MVMIGGTVQAHARKAAHTLVRGMTFHLLPLHRAEGGYIMEIVNTVVEIINQVGFPIACVVAMFWQTEKERAAHAEESNKWVDALNRNTAVIERLMERIGS